MTIDTSQSDATTHFTTVAIFDSHDFAEAAVKELAQARFDITKITIVGRGFHTDEHVTGFYNMGDRVRIWGKNGLLWGSLWGLLAGGLFMTMPVLGPIVVVGHLAAMVAAAAEGAVMVGGLSVLGAALSGIGIPEDSVLRYEEVLKADGFLVIVHGNAEDADRARTILANGHSKHLDSYNELNMNLPVVTPLYKN
jgi:hypothetical protein